MKSKTNQLTLIYIITAVFLAIVFHKLSLKYFLIADYPFYTFSKDLILSFTGITLGISYPLTITETESFWKLKKNNDEIKESNERYDIVAKATSDTIWDWKIQEDDLLEQRNKSIFGYENIRLATVQNGGLIIYTRRQHQNVY
jgi:hypothetical protein